MKLKSFCLPTKREVPSDAKMISHILMLRSGMIKMETSGIYTWLPLGFKVLKKIQNIIEDYHESESVNQILMPTIQSAEIWKQSSRYHSYGQEMLKINDRNNKELLYGPTNEEMMTKIGKEVIKSYKNLPLKFFHVQSKFRDEIRPRFGVMRAREFLMKDAYSFDLNEKLAYLSYTFFFNLYLKIFKKLGITVLPVKALSGEIGGNLSHEFHVICESGESDIVLEDSLSIDSLRSASFEDYNNKLYTATKEYMERDNVKVKTKLKRSIELGHIFLFGTKYSKSFKFNINSPEGDFYPYMGSYGIGVSRLPAAIIEVNNDKNGIIWPLEISPFDLIIINLHINDEKCSNFCSYIYEKLKEKNIDPLLDDRDERIGVKFSDADLIGIPYQVIIGRDYKDKNIIEIKNRRSGKKESVSEDSFFKIITKKIDND